MGEALIFEAKAAGLRLLRSARNLRTFSLRTRRRTRDLCEAPVIAEVKQPLRSLGPASERWLQNGKIQNLRVAARALDGCEVAAGETFSFWREAGRPVRSRGFTEGRELREGCIIASVGGGLCQLSNALYQAALDAQFNIVERHSHSKVVPGSVAAIDRDATVFWNYIDLRFSADQPFRIETSLSQQELIVRFRAWNASRGTNQPSGAEPAVRATPNDCASCGIAQCFRHDSSKRESKPAGTAFIVDDLWPELDRYLISHSLDGDEIALPIDGKRFHAAAYAWTTTSFSRVSQKPLLVMRRSVTSRRLAAQGAERQRALLRMDAMMAKALSRSISPSVEHLVVSLSLLPFLWREGTLGGRSFDVLANRLPLALIHEKLDRARLLHPESRTAGDFRADDRLLADEEAALSASSRLITPHRWLAAQFGPRATLIDWDLPRSGKRQAGANVVFPASALARKGAFELREALRGLDISLVTTGSSIETSDFWRGLPVTRIGLHDHWLENASVVVLPAFVESHPRLLLKALGSGVPVIASHECGLDGLEGVTSVDAGDAAALRESLRRVTG